MERIPSTNIKLKTVTDIIGIKPQKERQQAQPVITKKVVQKQILDDSHNIEPSFLPRRNSDIQRVKSSKLPNTQVTNLQDGQLPNNKLIFAPQKERKQSIKHYTQIPQGLAPEKYHLNQQNKSFKRNVVDDFKKELIVRDFYQHPLKYKIVNESLGINPQKIYKLKHSELSHIQEQYQKNKGIEYLRQSRQRHNVRIKTEVPQTANFNIRIKRGKLDLRIRAKSQKNLKGKKAIIEDLRQKEDTMGKIVYQRVKRHLKQQKVSTDFNKRVHSQQAIDRALIDFLKLKIQRAQTTLKQI